MSQKFMLKHSILITRVLKYLGAAVVVMVPLFPKFPLIRVPGTFVSIRLEDFLLALSAAILFFVLVPRSYQLIKDKVVQGIFVFLMTGLLSFGWAALVSDTVLPHIGFLHWARRIEYFIPFFLAFEIVRRDRGTIDFYMKILVGVMIALFIYGAGQRFFYWPIIITQNEEYSKGVALRWTEGSHINSTFAGHYDLGTFLIIALSITIPAVFIVRGKISKVMFSIASLGGLWLLVMSASRISLVAYTVSAVLALYILRRYLLIPVVIGITVLFSLMSPNLISRYQRIYDVTIGPMISNVFTITTYASDTSISIRRAVETPTPTPPPVFEDRSTNIRLAVEWPRAVRAFTKNPLTGTGYSSITLATDNEYLRLLGEIGIYGLLAFVLLFINLGLQFTHLIKLKVILFYLDVKHLNSVEQVFLAGVLGSQLGIFMNALFIDVFVASKFAILYWFFIGLALSLVRSLPYEKKTK